MTSALQGRTTAFNRFGTVFKLTPGGSLTVLHNFTGGRDGANPYAPPIQGRDGSFYAIALIEKLAEP